MRSSRILAGVLCISFTAAACSSSAGTTTTHTQATGTTTTRPNLSKVLPPTTTTIPVPTGLSACTTVTATAGKAQASAGTVYGTVLLADDGSSSCTILGYPGLVRSATDGSTVPLNIINGLTIGIQGLFDRPPAVVTVTPTQKAEFTYQYSTVPTGSETNCLDSTRLSVELPGSSTPSTPFHLALAPCNGATVYVSAIYAPGSVGKPFT
jgi:hypothetical protein